MAESDHQLTKFDLKQIHIKLLAQLPTLDKNMYHDHMLVIHRVKRDQTYLRFYHKFC